MTKFRHLPAAGRAIIVVVAIGVFAIALVACATSYNAIYRLVGQLGLYGYRINQAFPLLLDAAFLVAELAAILGGIMRAVIRSDEVSAGWPGAAMLLCGLGTIGFNVGHAYLLGGRGDPLTVWRCVVAALPPVLMMVSFQVLIAIVKWVMLHLGRPLNSAAALSPAVTGYGMVPPASYGLFPPHPVYGQVPSVGQQGVGQNGHGELAEPDQAGRGRDVPFPAEPPGAWGGHRQLGRGRPGRPGDRGRGDLRRPHSRRMAGRAPNPQQASAQGRPVSRSRRGAGPLVGSVEAALDRSARRGSGPDGHAAEPHPEGGSR
jgi:hypothetical protein